MLRIGRYVIWLVLISLIGIDMSCTTGSPATYPAFDTSVIASSSVSNMQNVALESHLRSALIGSDETVPGEVKYSVSISGANRSDDQGAVGTAKTRFVVSSLEGRDSDLNESSERVWRDQTQVTGTIVNLMKNFEYTSGIRL